MNSSLTQNHHVAAVYTGAATCGPDCYLDMERLAERAGFTVKEVDHVAAADLADVALYVQPGGNASVDEDKVHVADQLTVVRDFVQNGGAYFGSCMGAFLAAEGEGLYGFLTHEAGYYVAVHNERVAREGGTVLDDVASHIIKVAYGSGKRDMLYAGGPHFADEPVQDVVARYEEGLPAALVVPYGRGKVALAGPHPEATEYWYRQAPEYDAAHPQPLAQDIALDLIARATAR